MTTTITKHTSSDGHPYAVATDTEHPLTGNHLPPGEVAPVGALAAGFIATLAGGVSTENPPTVYPPGFHSSGWTVAYEGAYEWSIHFTYDPQMREYAAEHGLFFEPVNAWCLGVYPA